MNNASAVAGGIAAGAIAMYFLDPERGRRRRARLRDQAIRVVNIKRDAFGKMGRDFRNRSQGVFHEIQARLGPDDASDEIIVERIHSSLGRCGCHTGAIDLEVVDGTAILRGHALASEVEELIGAVEGVRGVRRVKNELEVHASDDGVAALQGDLPVARRDLDVLSEVWSPATSLVMGVAGGALAAYGATRRDLAGAALSTVGATILMRSFRDMEGRRIFATVSHQQPS